MSNVTNYFRLQISDFLLQISKKIYNFQINTFSNFQINIWECQLP
jgi:hypothetical protein